MIKQQSTSKHDLLTKVLFGIYFILLSWIILLKTEFSLQHLYGVRTINLIPFGDSLIINGKIDYSEIYLNILIFVPFGIYLSMLKPNWSKGEKVIPIFLVSLSFETLQYILAIGATDITDLIGNTVGGFLGVLTYVILNKLFKDARKTNKYVNVLAGLVTAGIIILATLLILVNS